MSGDGPESIPTSADPRSKRPVKKRALTPVSAQAATVEALFAKPDQEIRLPRPVDDAGGGRPRSAVPPEIVSNVQGSSSGAGSGEFHVYKASRRREYARLRELDAAAQREREAAAFAAGKRERETRDDEKTRRNREKREKAKARKAAKDKAGPAPAAAAAAATSAANDSKRETNGASGANGTDSTDEPAGAAATADGAKTAAPDGDGKDAVPRAQAAEPVPVPDGPGLLIQDDDDDD